MPHLLVAERSPARARSRASGATRRSACRVRAPCSPRRRSLVLVSRGGAPFRQMPRRRRRKVHRSIPSVSARRSDVECGHPVARRSGGHRFGQARNARSPPRLPPPTRTARHPRSPRCRATFLPRSPLSAASRRLRFAACASRPDTPAANSCRGARGAGIPAHVRSLLSRAVPADSRPFAVGATKAGEFVRAHEELTGPDVNHGGVTEFGRHASGPGTRVRRLETILVENDFGARCGRACERSEDGQLRQCGYRQEWQVRAARLGQPLNLGEDTIGSSAHAVGRRS